MSPEPSDYPHCLALHIRRPTSLWKKIIFIARKKEWTPREVVEQAISVLYYHLDNEIKKGL